MASIKYSALISLFVFISFGSFAQDSIVSIYPTFITGLYTNQKLNINENNPLLILSVPVSFNKFYGEVRYNYDQINTIGVYLGYQFSIGKKQQHNLIPQIGFLYGDYVGTSFQFYYQLLHSKFEINFQNQYGLSFNNLSSFYYNWSDIQFKVRKKINFGSSIQIYKDKNSKYIDLGALVTYKSNNWTVALYSFNFYDLPKHYFAFGIQKGLTFKKRVLRK